MSTSQGDTSNDSRQQISNSLKAGLDGHTAFMEKQSPLMRYAQNMAAQRVYVSRSIGSNNVLESEKSAEEKTQALVEINAENKARLRNPNFETQADYNSAKLVDEWACYRKLTEFCDDGLVGRLLKANGLSADHQCEVEQFSSRLLWTSPDTAAATLFVRLKDKDEVKDTVENTHSSSAGPGHTSTSAESRTAASRQSVLVRSKIKLQQRLHSAATSLSDRFKVKDTHLSSADPRQTSTSEESRNSASRHTVLARIDGGTESAWPAGDPEPGPEDEDWRPLNTSYKKPERNGDWRKAHRTRASGGSD